MKARIIVILILFSTVAWNTAKSQDEGLSIGLRGGLNLQNINGKDLQGDKLELNLVPRFHVGVLAEIPIVPDFYFRPELLFTTKGAKSDNSFLGVDMIATYNLSYLELPLNFVYKPQVGSGRFYIGFGPYIAYGIGGKASFEVAGIKTEANIVYESKHAGINPAQWKYFRPFDFGGNLFFGYELENGIFVQFNTQLGMAKINSDNTTLPDGKAEFRNTGFGLSLGYMF